jgi:hypothetical protein
MPESDIDKLLFIMQSVLVAQKSGLSTRMEKYGLLGRVVVSQILHRNWCGCDYVILYDPAWQQVSCKYCSQEREYGCLIPSSTVSIHSLVWLQPAYFWFLA